MCHGMASEETTDDQSFQTPEKRNRNRPDLTGGGDVVGFGPGAVVGGGGVGRQQLRVVVRRRRAQREVVQRSVLE